MTFNSDDHFTQLAKMKVPVKRAAYSDRMAWTMSILAKLVYLPFDEESNDILKDLAAELAALTSGETSEEDIKKRLARFALTLADIGRAGGGDTDNKVLKAALEVGGFTLVGGAPIHDRVTETQAFVVHHKGKEGENYVVVCFRGTQQIRDWMTNIKIKPTPIASPKGDGNMIGNMHDGFHSAYKAVEPAIKERLEKKEVKDLPIYVTGHSLGGALSVVATWYLSAQKLAACYTFGAPRVGDQGLEGRFKTPIYRIVNAADPVPFIPPSSLTVSGLKAFLRTLETLLPWFGAVGWLVKKSINLQGMRHYGDMRYLPFAAPGPDGSYPNLMIRGHVGNGSRLYRYWKMLWKNKGMPWRINKFNPDNDPVRPDKPKSTPSKPSQSIEPDRIDQYHNMDRYCDKLRAVAHHKNP